MTIQVIGPQSKETVKSVDHTSEGVKRFFPSRVYLKIPSICRPGEIVKGPRSESFDKVNLNIKCRKK